MDFSKLTEYLDSLATTYCVPGCDCAVLYRHEPVYRHTTGFADTSHTRKVNENDLYFLFSATKVITCTAVMQLVEQGKLSLEDTVEQYLPEFHNMNVLCEMPSMPVFSLPQDAPVRPAKNKIKIIDLLSMTAGLSYDTETGPIHELQQATARKATTRQMVAAIARTPLLCEPGTHWIYSLSHDVLGAVIEVISGKSFYTYLRENIFDVLGMQDVFFDLPKAQKHRLSALYAHDRNSPAVLPVAQENRFRLSDCYESGGAGLVTSVNEYVKFLDAMSGGGVSKDGKRILKRETIDLMRKNHLNEAELQDFAKSGKKGYGYALGVRTLIDPAASLSPVGEFGWDGAAGAYVLIDPDNEIGIFYAEHILGHLDSYFHIHPTIRDIVYRTILG